MATYYDSKPAFDPDQLGYEVNPASFAAGTEEILIFTTTKTIALKVNSTTPYSGLTTDGATIKAIYSKLKDAWRTNSTLIKFPFPMGPITDEQFEMLNGWNWDKTNTSGDALLLTTELIRTGGWSVVDPSTSKMSEQWTGVVTLGSLGQSDQVYLQQVNTLQAPVNIKLTGPVNQAVQIYSDPNADGSVADGYDRTGYFKIFVREWEKIYAQSEIADIGVSSLTYQAYRYPLTNSGDLKIAVTAANITSQLDANADGFPDIGVYANVNVTYLRDSNGAFYTVLGDFAASTAYVIGNVVKDTGNNRWYKCILGYTSTATLPSADATHWAAYEGERLIGSFYYPYTIIIDGDTTVGPSVSGAARTNQIYTAIQYMLKYNIDIDSTSGTTGATDTVYGKTASSLLRFVGDTLVTAKGVYIDSFNTQDTNAITFTDALNSANTFPYVAAFTVNFGENLQNDQYSKYWVFFTSSVSPTGDDFGTATAIIVQDKDGLNMAGDVNPSWPTKRAAVSHSYNYDSNNQRSGGTYNSGSGSQSTDAPVTVVGIGLSTGQYVKATGVIQKSTANAATLTASLERNYSQGTTYP